MAVATAQAAGAERPPPYLFGPPSRPTVVRVGFYLTDVSAVDEREESAEIEAELSLRWRDPRMAFEPEAAGLARKVYQGEFQFSELYDGWWPQLVLVNGDRSDESGAVLLEIEPDGAMTYLEKFTARIETPMALERFPFDAQQLRAYFEVFGFGRDEVRLEVDPENTGRAHRYVRLAGWQLRDVGAAVEDGAHSVSDGTRRFHELVVTLDVRRRPGFVVVTILLPLTLLVMLTWSVFWMADDSISDRLNVTFIGILSVVAYQIIVHDLLPRISYFTLMDGFLTLTLVVMALAVVVNLAIDRLNRRGQRALGDRIDEVCRWLFPLGFFAANALVYVLV